MRILVLTIGQRVPGWVDQGFDDYARRMPRECRVELQALATPGRGRRQPPDACRAREAELLLSRVPPRARVLALDEAGEAWSTRQLSTRLQSWLGDGRDVALLVGGPDGLDGRCLQAAEAVWSLSMLTFPHALVRVLLAEQIYRAWSLGRGHPYHRD